MINSLGVPAVVVGNKKPVERSWDHGLVSLQMCKAGVVAIVLLLTWPPQSTGLCQQAPESCCACSQTHKDCLQQPSPRNFRDERGQSSRALPIVLTPDCVKASLQEISYLVWICLWQARLIIFVCVQEITVQIQAVICQHLALYLIE